MCKECEEWKEKANSIWNIVFKEMERFQSLIKNIPDNMLDDYRNQKPKNSLEKIKEKIISWGDDKLDDWYKIIQAEKRRNEEREELVITGQKWIDYFEEQIDWAINVIYQQNKQKTIQQEFVKTDLESPFGDQELDPPPNIFFNSELMKRQFIPKLPQFNNQNIPMANNPELALIEMEARNKMMNEFMATMNRINASNAALQQDMSSALRESAQGWVDTLGGRPVINLRFRRF